MALRKTAGLLVAVGIGIMPSSPNMAWLPMKSGVLLGEQVVQADNGGCKVTLYEPVQALEKISHRAFNSQICRSTPLFPLHKDGLFAIPGVIFLRHQPLCLWSRLKLLGRSVAS